jgi:hypothetical protein
MIVKLDNAAFDADLGPLELERILKDMAAKVIRGALLADGDGSHVRDVNGNNVGKWSIRSR